MDSLCFCGSFTWQCICWNLDYQKNPSPTHLCFLTPVCLCSLTQGNCTTLSALIRWSDVSSIPLHSEGDQNCNVDQVLKLRGHLPEFLWHILTLSLPRLMDPGWSYPLSIQTLILPKSPAHGGFLLPRSELPLACAKSQSHMKLNLTLFLQGQVNIRTRIFCRTFVP